MHRRGKQSEIHRTEILKVSICTDEESKVKDTELKYCRLHYAEMSKAK